MNCRTSSCTPRFLAVAVIAILMVAGTAAWAQEETASCPTSPSYAPDFSGNQSCLARNPSSGTTPVFAGTSPTVFQLTSGTANQTGATWYTTPQVVQNGFTSSFQFQFTSPSSPPADGIAFVIQNSSASAIGYTGGNGGALGYGDADASINPSTGAGIPNSLAIEFDTFQNAWDPAAVNGSVSHVAVQSCGTGPNTSHHNQLCGGNSGSNSTLGAPVVTPNMSDGAIHNVTITYFAACSTCSPATPANLHVKLDGVDLYPNGVNADLSSIGLGDGGTAFVGFTGATGGDFETQNILNWEFTPQQLLQGSPINPNNPANLFQPFVFNNTTGNQVEVDFDYTTAFNTVSGDPTSNLIVVSKTIPTVSDQGISQATYQAMVAGTSLATTSCFTANGEGTDGSGNPLCAQMTITCTNANSSTPAGDNCPQSTQRNLYWALRLDTPGTGMSIPVGAAPVVPEGSDNWSALPGSCVFEGPETGNLCPQSTLTQFELVSLDNGPRSGGTGTTTNSSFVAGCCEPEWNTVPSIPMWSNSTAVPVSFTAFPPNPASQSNNWVAAPNKSITWGEEALNATPDTTFPVPGDTLIVNPNPTGVAGKTTCPTAWPTPGTVPPSFTTPAGQTVMVSGPGVYEVHFFSTACDNQEELAFPAIISAASPNNVAAFKTASFGVDMTKPTISTPVLNGGIGNNTFGPGSNATASFICTDDLSGLAGCGKNVLPLPVSYGPAQQPPTVGPRAGLLSQNVSGYPVPTSTVGLQTLTVYATDLAGNQSSASAQYCVGYKIVSVDNAGNLGFTAPVLNPGPNPASPNINSASVNQAIPLQIAVTDCNGNPVTNLALAPAGTVVLSAANAGVCKVDTTDNTISTAAAGNSGWQNLGGGIYQYNWKPLPPKGSCLSFSLNLGDGIAHTAYFSFK
jgi:hypothetical protein